LFSAPGGGPAAAPPPAAAAVRPPPWGGRPDPPPSPPPSPPAKRAVIARAWASKRALSWRNWWDTSASRPSSPLGDASRARMDARTAARLRAGRHAPLGGRARVSRQMRPALSMLGW